MADRVVGLELGADDYLVKPFALEELMARVRAVLRRRGAIPEVLEVGRLLVDEEHGFAARAGRELALTSTELRLLAFLIRHRGQALSKDQLLTQVWGYDAYDPNLVEVHISALRRKLEANGPRLIHGPRDRLPVLAVSGHRRARTRLIAVSMLGIVAALATFVVLITVRYRDGLEQRLRTDLTSGATALAAARTPAAFKSVLGSLAAEGISVDLAGITAAGGTLQATPGEAVLTVHELIPVSGREVPATLTGSRAWIDRQVRSLEVTEAIGGVIALALTATLACVLVLLDRAVSEARASEAAMRTFLADASHELRTPAAALQATAERLLRDQPPRPARDAIEAQLARESGRLGHLVDDLLNLARLDARERPHRATR